MELTSTIPFNTATPNSVMNPIDPERFRFRPRGHSAATPPTTSAKGMLSRISGTSARSDLPRQHSRVNSARITPTRATSVRKAALAGCFERLLQVGERVGLLPVLEGCVEIRAHVLVSRNQSRVGLKL